MFGVYEIDPRGQFYKSWAQSANHRDSSNHLRPMPTPNFLRKFLLAKSCAHGHRAQKQFLKLTPGLHTAARAGVK